MILPRKEIAAMLSECSREMTRQGDMPLVSALADDSEHGPARRIREITRTYP